jgi:hypothetical protein
MRVNEMKRLPQEFQFHCNGMPLPFESRPVLWFLAGRISSLAQQTPGEEAWPRRPESPWSRLQQMVSPNAGLPARVS